MHRAGDGIGDIVHFQVEEDRQSDPRDFVDAVMAMRAEEFEPELEPADMSLDQLRQRGGGIELGDVEREKDRVVVHQVRSVFGGGGAVSLPVSACVSGSGSTESGIPSPSRSLMVSVFALP